MGNIASTGKVCTPFGVQVDEFDSTTALITPYSAATCETVSPIVDASNVNSGGDKAKSTSAHSGDHKDTSEKQERKSNTLTLDREFISTMSRQYRLDSSGGTNRQIEWRDDGEDEAATKIPNLPISLPTINRLEAKCDTNASSMIPSTQLNVSAGEGEKSQSPVSSSQPSASQASIRSSSIISSYSNTNIVAPASTVIPPYVASNASDLSYVGVTANSKTCDKRKCFSRGVRTLQTIFEEDALVVC